MSQYNSIADEEDYIEQELEAYIDFMEEDEQESTGFVTRKRVMADFDKICPLLNTFIVYPDLLVDIITPKKSKFKLHLIQRMMLRALSRGTATYITASRGTSKSFVADLSRYLNCIFIPRHQTTITAGTNKQAAEIAKQKIVDDLWVKLPFLANEMQKRRIAGKLLDAYKMGNDYVEFNFRNGSSLNLGNCRGLRRNSIIFEEIIEQDETKVNEVYLPLLNAPRLLSDGAINPYEPQSQQIYITTAGFQGTFAYQKIIEILCRSIIEPDKYTVMLSTYKVPLFLGITTKRQVEDIINSPSFSKASFEREYCSKWSDAPAGAAFSSNIITALRQVKVVELKDKRTTKQEQDGVFYVMCADMAKDGAADTAIGIAKITPKDHCFSYKFINLLTINSTDYMVIANEFKKLALTYNISMLIYDANGVGASLRDWLNKPTTDANGTLLPGFGIINPPDAALHDLIRYPKSQTIVYEIKSGGRIGEQIHFHFFSRMSTGFITFPIKLQEAINLYSQNKTFMSMSKRKQQEYLMPFKTMDLMELELKNLDIANTSDNMSNTMKIVRRNTAIQKDFFSMAEYLIWAVNEYIERPLYSSKTKRSGVRELVFIS